MRKVRMVLLVAALGCLPCACNTPEAVADFCGSSQTALESTVPIFRDLGWSCLRVENLEKGIGSFETVESNPSCEAIRKQSDASVAAVRILGEYFGALDALAKYGVTKTASDANDLAAKAAGLSGASADAQTAIGSIAKFLTTAAVSAYQVKSLNKDIVEVNKNVAVVTDALTQILEKNYLDQELTDEQKKLAVHYKEFAQAHANEGAVAVMLDSRWSNDQRELARRRAAAEDAMRALGTIKDGMAALASTSGSLKAKELPGLLEPYVAQLKDLVPQMQKAF